MMLIKICINLLLRYLIVMPMFSLERKKIAIFFLSREKYL